MLSVKKFTGMDNKDASSIHLNGSTFSFPILGVWLLYAVKGIKQEFGF